MNSRHPETVIIMGVTLVSGLTNDGARTLFPSEWGL